MCEISRVLERAGFNVSKDVIGKKPRDGVVKRFGNHLVRATVGPASEESLDRSNAIKPVLNEVANGRMLVRHGRRPLNVPSLGRGRIRKRCQCRCVERWLNYTRDMKIGAAARASGLTIKAIRHYESARLLRDVRRSGAYRDFSDRDVDTLRLAAHCRGLGFSVAETKDVLALVTASKPDCPPPDQMNAIVGNRLQTVRAEIRELKRKARELEKVSAYVQKRLAGA